MQLSTKGRYAVIAMLGLYQELQYRAYVPLSFIAEKEGISLTYLEQLFGKLKKSKLVISARGTSGGYALGYAAPDIKVVDIIMAADENLFLTRCDPLATRGCKPNGTLCKTHHLWEELTNRVLSFLEGVSLEDLAKGAIPMGAPSIHLDRKQVANEV